MQTSILKIMCFFTATAGYLLAVYVIMPWIMSFYHVKRGFKVTDVAAAFTFEYIIGCIIACVIWLVLSGLLAHIVIKAWWLGGCALVAAGLIIIAVAGWQELTKESKLISYKEFYDNGVIRESGMKTNNSSGRIHGKVTRYYPSGEMWATETYVMDELRGECEIFHKNGQLMAKGTGQGKEWLDEERVPIPDGEWTFYREDGGVDDVRVYNRGELVSSQNYLYFYDSDWNICTISDKKRFTGTLEMSGIVTRYYFPNLFNGKVIDGKFDGEISSYYNIGEKPSIAVVARYNKGKLTGEYRAYYTNGQLSSERNYLDGKYDGEYKSYYEDSLATRPHGQLKYKAYYNHSGRYGLACWYYKNGKIEAESNYVNGKKNGISRQWKEDGTFISVYHYVDDIKDGAYERHEEDIHTKGVYKEGKEISSVSCRYYPDGKLKSLLETRGRDKIVRREEYDENGDVI